MDKAVADALAEVKSAFSDRRRPRSVPHCRMCYTDEEVSRFLARPAEYMSPEDLRPILWDGYVCWGTWREVAHYIPRLLELYADDMLPDEGRFCVQLLTPAPPELGRFECGGERMSAEERQSIFWYVQAVLLSRLERPVDHAQTWIMAETLGFLAAFDVPLEPFLRRLLDSPSAQVRANVCVFMAEYVWGQQPFENRRLKTLIPLLENRAALDRFLSPEIVAAFLVEHASEASLFGPEPEAYVGMAFDWAISEVQAKP